MTRLPCCKLFAAKNMLVAETGRLIAVGRLFEFKPLHFGTQYPWDRSRLTASSENEVLHQSHPPKHPAQIHPQKSKQHMHGGFERLAFPKL